MTTAEIKPFIGQMCLVKYGETGSLSGTLKSVGTHSLQIKEVMGEYSIPLEQVTSVSPVTVAT
jgi:hypothetical protein